MGNIIQAILNAGVVEGMTYRARFEEGVGMVIEPNPALTRMNCHAVPVPIARPRRDGRWIAKPLHLTW